MIDRIGLGSPNKRVESNLIFAIVFTGITDIKRPVEYPSIICTPCIIHTNLPKSIQGTANQFFKCSPRQIVVCFVLVVTGLFGIHRTRSRVRTCIRETCGNGRECHRQIDHIARRNNVEVTRRIQASGTPYRTGIVTSDKGIVGIAAKAVVKTYTIRIL